MADVTVLFIGGLPPQTVEADLASLLAEYGVTENQIQLQKNSKNDNKHAKAPVPAAQVDAAISKLNGQIIHGKKISAKVDDRQPQTSAAPATEVTVELSGEQPQEVAAKPKPASAEPKLEERQPRIKPSIPERASPDGFIHISLRSFDSHGKLSGTSYEVQFENKVELRYGPEDNRKEGNPDCYTPVQLEIPESGFTTLMVKLTDTKNANNTIMTIIDDRTGKQTRHLLMN